MRKLFVFAALAIIMLASAALCAENPPMPGDQHCAPGGMPPGHGISILNFAEELNLTGEQFEKLKAIEKESAAAEEKLARETRSLMEELRRETDKDNPDGKKLADIIDRITANHKAMLTSHVHDMIKIKSVLTKEQQKALKEMFQKHRKMMKDGPPGMKGEGRPF